MDMQGNKIYAVDFDGTLSLDGHFPETGMPNEPLFDMLKHEQKKGARIILFTCRVNEALKRAVAFCRENGLVFDAINKNLPEMIEKYGTDTRKIYADFYIDDRNLKFPSVVHHEYKPKSEAEAKAIKNFKIKAQVLAIEEYFERKRKQGQI